MNANINTYFERSRATAQTSDSIRKAYLSNSRKAAWAGAIDSAVMWYIIVALKVIGGIICAVSFFTILGKVELGTLSPLAGIISALVVAPLECLCFIPIGKRPTKKSRK